MAVGDESRVGKKVFLCIPSFSLASKKLKSGYLSKREKSLEGMGAQTIDKGVKSPAYKIHSNQDNLKVPKSRKMANLPSQGTIQPGCSRVLWGTLSAVGTLQHCHRRFLDYSWHEHLCS